MDLGTGLALFGSAEIVGKILGPTAEYLGESLRDITKKRAENIRKIFDKASKRINEQNIPNEGVDPYLIKTIFDYGSYTEDDFIQSYLAGLLVSSLNNKGNDNRASVYASIVQGMSCYQVRTHYLLYTILNKLYKGSKINITDQKQAESLQTYVSEALFNNVVFITDHDKENSPFLYEHIMHGLCRLQLIQTNFVFGSAKHISKFGPPYVESPGVLFQPSVFGIELYLWATMRNEKTYSNMILDPSIQFPEFVDFEIQGNAFKLPV